MKEVPFTLAVNQIVGIDVGEVLQVTPRSCPVPGFASATSVTKISLLAVTAVVLTLHVVPEALVAQENIPALDAPQATSDGLAAVPTAAQLLVVE